MNPVFRRELLGAFRARNALAVQVTLAAACAVLVLVRWPSGGVGDLNGARSAEVLRVFGYGALAGILLLTPAGPATALARERVQGTLALLLNSPMSPRAIYRGKLGGTLAYTGVLLLMALPAAAACHALGGTSVRGGVALLFAVLALAAVQTATLGLLVSSRCQSADGALRLTYGLVLAVGLLPLAPHWMLQGGPPGVTALTGWLHCVSPVPAVAEVLGQGDAGTHGMGTAVGAPARYAVLAGAMSLACAAATTRRLNLATYDRPRPAGTPAPRSGAGRTARRVMFLVDPQRRGVGIGDRVNPVMAKEFLSRRFGRSHWMLRLAAGCTVLSLVLSYVVAGGALGWGVELIGGAMVLLQIALLVVFTPSLAAGLISGERESGGWLLLRLTPLSPGAILRGKLLSVAWPLLLMLGATLPGYLLMAAVEPTLAGQVPKVVFTLVLTAVFAVVTSAAVGSLFRSTAAATTTSYTVLSAVCLAPLLVWLARGAPFGPRTVETMLTASPVAAAFNAARTPGFVEYDLLPANWWLVGAVSLGAVAFLHLRTWRLYRPT